MAFRELHSKCLKIKYKNNFFSKANFFILLTNIISVVVPLVIVLYNNDIWNRIIVINKQPSVRFKGNYHFQAFTNNSSRPIFCSNFPFLAKFDKHLLDTCSYIKAKEVDIDDDGQTDLFQFTTHALLDSIKIKSVLLILSFDYELQGTCNVNMETLITSEHLINENACEVNTYGILEFSQLVPVSCSKFSKSVVELSDIINQKQLVLYKIQDLLEYHSNQNCTWIYTRGHLPGDEATSAQTTN